MTRLLGRFAYNGSTLIGELDGDTLRVLSRADDLASHLNGHLNGLPRAQEDRLGVEEVDWLPALSPAARVLAVALNYVGHAQETGSTPPERPLFFYKPPSSFVGHRGVLDPHADLTGQFDYEGEIGVVIGRTCRTVTPATALEYVAGIVALDDGSARDRQRITAGERQLSDWIGAKALDRSSAIGPVVATGEEVRRGLRERTLGLTTEVNGIPRQEGSIDDLVFPVEVLIAEASTHMTLVPGDVIATGTPSGVGLATGTFLKPNDTLTIQVSMLPALTVTVGQ